jgi:hypothetical protein
MDTSNQETFSGIRAKDRYFPRIPLRYISSRSDKNEVIRKSELIRKSTGSRIVTLSQDNHRRRQARSEDRRSSERMERVLGTH